MERHARANSMGDLPPPAEATGRGKGQQRSQHKDGTSETTGTPFSRGTSDRTRNQSADGSSVFYQPAAFAFRCSSATSCC